MASTPLSIELPVCGRCRHVGKLPIGLFSGKGWCTGPKEAPHKKQRMQPRRFVEVVEAGADRGFGRAVA